jgi:hypothetical protein
VDSAVIRTWLDGGAVRAQVIVRIRNDSDGWIALAPGRTGYTLRSRTGAVTGSGRFAYAFPQDVAPKGVSYLFDAVAASFAPAEDLAEVTIDPRPPAASVEAAMGSLSTRDVEWTAGSGSLEGSITVEATGEAPVDGVVIGLVFLDGTQRPLAVLYDPGPRTIDPGKPVPVALHYPAAGPVDASSVAAVEAFAFPYAP